MCVRVCVWSSVNIWEQSKQIKIAFVKKGANRSSPSPQIPLISCNLTVHYRIHNSPPPVPIPSQSTPASHFLKIQFNIILPSKPRYSKWSFSLSFPTKILYAPLLSRCVLHDPPIPFVLSTPLLTRTSLSTLLCNTLGSMRQTKINTHKPHTCNWSKCQRDV